MKNHGNVTLDSLSKQLAVAGIGHVLVLARYSPKQKFLPGSWVIVKPVKHGEVDCKISGKHGMIVPPRIQVKSTERVVKFDDGTTSVVNTAMLVLAPIRLQHMQVFKAAAASTKNHGRSRHGHGREREQ